ncbi:MAG: M3 family oligoendopeptidase [Phototrophicaceae bacterium]
MLNAPDKPQTGAENVIWDLSVLYASLEDPQIQTDMQALEARVQTFANEYRGKIASLSAAVLNKAVAELESIYDGMVRLSAFAQLHHATASNDSAVGKLIQRVQLFGSQLTEQLVFFEVEWKLVPDEQIQTLLADPLLAHYRHYLESDLRYKPYMLSEAEEKILVATSISGRSAWTRFFSQLTTAMRYDWEGQQITQSELLPKLYHADRDVRQRAADALTAGLVGKQMELSYIFNVLAADKATSDRLRNYPTWITSRNLSNKAPDSVVEALVNSVTSSYDLVARHYKLKRTLLGYDELYDYDRYAPLPFSAEDRTYSWGEAQKIVLDAFGKFNEDMGEVAGYFFERNWIHAPVLPDKRGGAFAASMTPSTHPFVLVNFTGRGRDVSTLAHELGHGVHQYLAGQAQGLFGADTPLTTSEMASTFGEMLVFQDLMAQEQNPKARLAMLAGKIEDTFATVYRQTSMNRFEDAMHNGYRERGELTAEELGEMWLNSQQAMFQDSITLRPDYRHWWSYIPHFLHTPGYVYAYAFGELLVLALYELYHQQGPSFVPNYVEVLSAGGNDYPDRILAKVGVDLNDSGFWDKGIQVIRGFIEQEEALAREAFPEKF